MGRLPDVRTIAAASLEELPDRLVHVRQHFSLLLAWDAPEKLIGGELDALKILLYDGLIYFCAWGKNCERVHDTVDHCDIDRPQKVDHIIVTTWHEQETLKQAMFYFRHCVIPDRPLQNTRYDRFAVSIGRPDWHNDMVRYFSRRRAKA